MGGVQGGQPLQVQTPNGLMQVTVPKGLGPGQQFEMMVPVKQEPQIAQATPVAAAPQQPAYQQPQQQPQVVYQQAPQQPQVIVQQAPPQVVHHHVPPPMYGGYGYGPVGYYDPWGPGPGIGLGIGAGFVGGMIAGEM